MYIITGGAGFIGSAMVAKLNAEGITDILIVDNLSTSDKWKNLVGKRYVDYVHKDLFIDMLMNEQIAADDVEGFIHLGACSSTTERDADYLMENNFHFSTICAEWAASNDVRFIYASSAATYGEGEQGYADDDEVMWKLRPMNMYGYSKQLMDEWSARTGMIEKICGLKFFNVYGPNEYHKEDMRSVINKAYYQIKEKGQVKLFKSYKAEYKDGEQVRDFVYVKDCTEVMWWLLQHPEVNGIYNVGTGTARTWNSLVSAIFRALDLEPNIEYIEMPENLINQYQYFTEATMDKLKGAGCPCEFSSVEDGVRDYVVNYLEQDWQYL